MIDRLRNSQKFCKMIKLLINREKKIHSIVIFQFLEYRLNSKNHWTVWTIQVILIIFLCEISKLSKIDLKLKEDFHWDFHQIPSCQQIRLCYLKIYYWLCQVTPLRFHEWNHLPGTCINWCQLQDVCPAFCSHALCFVPMENKTK